MGATTFRWASVVLAVVAVVVIVVVLARWLRPRARCDVTHGTVWTNGLYITPGGGRETLRDIRPKRPTTTSRSIPRILWTYWNDDIEKAPPVVRACIASWRVHNPTADIRVVTPRSLRTYLPDFDASQYRDAETSVQKCANRIRLQLLWHYGGVWMDASILCTQSLDWVQAVQQHTGAQMVLFYMEGFTRPSSKYPLLENWFLAAVPRAPFVGQWYDELRRADTFPTVRDYLDDLERAKRVDLQRISGMLRTYMYMHAAAQRLLQAPVVEGDEDETGGLVCIPAEQGPYAYLAQNDWDMRRVCDCLNRNLNLNRVDDTTGDERRPRTVVPFLIKFRKPDRKHIAKGGRLPRLLQRYLNE